MAGYSGTPLVNKLGIKDGARLALFGEPGGFQELLAPLPAGVEIRRNPRSGVFDVIVFFAKREAGLTGSLPRLMTRMKPACGLWIAWPKKASGVETDVTEDFVRDLALDAGLVDNKVCAIDQTWSGLRLVIRLKDRRVK